MTRDEMIVYCLDKPFAVKEFPFDFVTPVFKVGGKMFALMSLDGELRISLKCNPERAIELREKHKTIIPAWHMNKKHWNTVKIDGTLATELIYELIDHSYELIVSKLTKTKKKELGF